MHYGSGRRLFLLLLLYGGVGTMKPGFRQLVRVGNGSSEPKVHSIQFSF